MNRRCFATQQAEGTFMAKSKRMAQPAREFTGLFDVSNKNVFIPGGYGGIGEAIAWGLAANGARVIVSGRSREKAEKLATEITAAGYKAAGISADVKSVPEIRASVDHVIKQFGHIDILVNCAGIQREQALLDVTEEAYDEVIEVNLKAAMFLGQAVARHQIKAKKGGKHIHILSVRSQLGLRGRGYSAYCSSKGGLALLVKQHAMELAPHNINVNGVAPTFVHTELVKHILGDKDFKANLIKRIPLGRIAETRDIVGPTLFFSSSASDFVTGQTLYVDGGITASQ
jgi:NAD(P)-dependent dehydrogenase (short-subunit alcohol dehydrogenase family)